MEGRPEMIPLPLLENLSSEQKDALMRQLYELVCRQAVRIVELEAQVRALQEQVQALQAQLAKDSHNSSKPPSSDGLKKKRTRPQSARGKSGRHPGGQTGHPGWTLKQTAHPDLIIHHRPECYPNRGGSLEGAKVVDEKHRRVFDLPPQELEVIEHRSLVVCCPLCGQVTINLQFGG